nr:flavin reductase family protein [Acidovorax sp. RAC01]
MAQFPSGISVVTTNGPAGRWGMTASAVCSVSDEPPTVLVCVNRNSRAHAVIRHNGALAINLLAIDQAHLATRFASKTEDEMHAEFLAEHWSADYEVPVLSSSVAWLFGRVVQHLDVASHTTFFVEILRTHCEDELVPAIYHRRSFTALAVKK